VDAGQGGTALLAQIRKVIADHFEVDESQVALGTSFVGDLKADSLDMAQLFMDIEEEFGIEISDEDSVRLKTVQDVVNYLSPSI